MTVEQWLILGLSAALVLFVALVALRQPNRERGRGRMTAAPSEPERLSIDAAEVLGLADDAGVALLHIAADGTIALANRAAHGYLGRAPGSLAGLSTMEAFVDHRVDETVRDGFVRGSADAELTFGGEPQRTILVSARREAGNGGIWLILRDLSELRRLQRIRTEFLDNLSHELRTPLTNMRLLAESLALDIAHHDVPARVREGLERIDVETGHLAQMVTELLDLARIERGTSALRRDEVDVGRVAESALDRLRVYGQRQGVRLRGEVVASAAERTISGDGERLEQVALNLLHNAIKFSPPGGEVLVRVAAEPDEVRLEVQDRGPGIPHRELERIFERFYKVDRARTRAGAGNGTGLGLSIARHIVEGHGGRIWAESEEGRGARFFVALPRRGASG